MKVSSVALLILIPLFVFTFGTIVGEDYATVTAYFAHPFPALIAALTLIVGFEHFQWRSGVDRRLVHGLAQKITIILIKCISYGLWPWVCSQLQNWHSKRRSR